MGSQNIGCFLCVFTSIYSFISLSSGIEALLDYAYEIQT